MFYWFSNQRHKKNYTVNVCNSPILKRYILIFFIYYEVTWCSAIGVKYHQDYTNSNNQTKDRHAHTQARRTFASLATNCSKPHPIRYQERFKHIWNAKVSEKTDEGRATNLETVLGRGPEAPVDGGESWRHHPRNLIGVAALHGLHLAGRDSPVPVWVLTSQTLW